ncbi:MAG: response regulator transcription factor [Kineosporiaceae bacterium]|nr:response regulator transcription factor [Kineosporiaceae bacterium]
MILDAEPDLTVVGEADDGGSAVELARRLHPDVVLMDVQMAPMDGVEATRILTRDASAEQPDALVQVLILTAFRVDEQVYRALRAGASGFLLKDAAPRELISAVRAIARGDGWLDPAVTRSLITEFADRPEHAGSGTTFECLTPREREVLVLVAHGKSNAEIAGWLGLGEATVKTHLARILMKAGLRDRSQAIAAAYQSGLVAPNSPPPPPAGRP